MPIDHKKLQTLRAGHEALRARYRQATAAAREASDAIGQLRAQHAPAGSRTEAADFWANADVSRLSTWLAAPAAEIELDRRLVQALIDAIEHAEQLHAECAPLRAELQTSTALMERLDAYVSAHRHDGPALHHPYPKPPKRSGKPSPYLEQHIKDRQ